jgi:hypothetical protein
MTTSPAGGLSLVLDLALALVSDPAIVTFSEFVTQPNTAASAVLNTPLTAFPTAGDSYVALSTGSTGSIPNPGTFASFNLNGGHVRGNTDFDVTIWRIGLDVPASVNCLGLDFQFLSEEYPDYVGSIFNDAFIGELDNSTWTTSDSKIDAANNFIFDSQGNPITVNSVVGLATANGAGTAFDGGVNKGGATGLLKARTPITPGPHTLYLSIFDQGDHVYDSAVLVDNLSLFTAAGGDCQAGVVDRPKIYLPIVFNHARQAPDLVVNSLDATSNTVSVTIKNIGNAPVVMPFWVDVYLNPNPVPSTVNQHWWELASQGLVWGVTRGIGVNETLTLTHGGPYYSAYHSRFTGSLPPGSSVWAQVDSVNLNSTYGGVLESHELAGGAYNNIFNTVSRSDSASGAAPANVGDAPPPVPSQKLPPRR